MTRVTSPETLRRLALVALVAGLAAGVAAAVARLKRRPRGTGIEVQDTYACGCGAQYRMSGMDRHRVFWPAGASESDPVLGDRCLSCDAPLPGGHETAAA